jgi:hypothetical protein
MVYFLLVNYLAAGAGFAGKLLFTKLPSNSYFEGCPNGLCSGVFQTRQSNH